MCAQALGILLADRGLVRLDAALVLGALAAGLGLACGWARIACALAVALAAGAAGLAARVERAERWAPPGAAELAVEATLREVSRSASGWRAELAGAAAAEPAGPVPPPRIRLLGPPTPRGTPAFEANRPGERVRVRARLARPAGRHNPGTGDLERDARRAGIGAVGRLAHPAFHVRLPGGGALGWLHAARARAGDRLAAAGPGGGLLRALALGEQGVLAPADRDAFAGLGIAHVLSVSGLHLALVAALAYAVLARGLRRSAWLSARRDTRRIALVAAVAAAGLYALASGWGVPVRRSLLMLAALALGALRARPAARLAPVWLAALAVLAVEPEALFSAGAQLSFAASAALVASRPFEAREARGWRGALHASATALAVTAPLAALRLGSRAPFGLVANLAFVPWTGWIVLPAALAAALAAALDLPGADALAALAERIAAATLALARLAAAALPGWAGRAEPAAPWLVACAVLAAAALRARSTAARAALALVISGLLAVAPPPAIEPAPPRVVVLDVGQGDAVLVQGRTGALLVDAGVAVPDGSDLGAAVVVPALRALGVRRLDLVAASHADLDHRGGLPAVLRAVPVARVWLPHGGVAEPGFAEVLEAARAAGAVVEERGAGSAPLTAGDLRVVPLWPPPGEIPDVSRNDRSLTLRVEAAGRAVLLPGDLEAGAEVQLLAARAPLRADVLKLGHHGSRTSSSAAWLAAVEGAVAVASAPRAGRFGMPHPEVVARARSAGYALWWTGRDGAVLIGLGPVLYVRGWP